MAKKKPGTWDDVEEFEKFGMLNVPIKTIPKYSRIEVEESGINDAGDDFSALYANGKKVGHWAGY